MADNTLESQQVEWDSLNSFDLGTVRDELEVSAASLPRVHDLDHGPHPRQAGISDHVATGQRGGADMRHADAPAGGHAASALPVAEAVGEGHAAKGQMSQASGAMTVHAGLDDVTPRQANPNFGPQTTASAATFVGHGSEHRSENGAYADITPSFPRGREVLSATARTNALTVTVTGPTLSTTTLTSSMVTCTAQGAPAYATYVMVRGPPYTGEFGQPVRMAVVSQSVDPTGYSYNAWPGLMSQSAVTGIQGGFWGAQPTHSFPPPGFDHGQIASRQVGRPVMPGMSGEQYLASSQYVGASALARPEATPSIGYDTKPKTIDFAGQTDFAWAETGSRAMSSGPGAPEQSSGAGEVGHLLSEDLRHADPPRAVREFPPTRMDVPTRSTPIQSPMFYQDPSTGYLVPLLSSVVQMPQANTVLDGRATGFTAEARGMGMQATEPVNVLQSATGSSSQLPAQPTSDASAGGRARFEMPLVKLQRFDGRGSLDAFLQQFEQLSEFM